jgi:hypothetical protein
LQSILSFPRSPSPVHDGLLHLVQHLPDLHLLLLHFLRRVLLGSQGSCQLLNLLFHLIPSVLLLAALKAPISASVLPMGPTKSSPSAGASYRNVLGDPAFSAVFFETVCSPPPSILAFLGLVFFGRWQITKTSRFLSAWPWSFGLRNLLYMKTLPFKP